MDDNINDIKTEFNSYPTSVKHEPIESVATILQNSIHHEINIKDEILEINDELIKEQNFESQQETTILNNTNRNTLELYCPFCYKLFKRKDQYREHVYIHTGERPYKCDFCEETFRQNSTLIAHERIHTGELPYRCKQCKKGFRTNIILKKHIKTVHLNIGKIQNKQVHSKIRKYKCGTCNKEFSSKNLRIHERIHSDERPYECSACDKKFRTFSSLYCHKSTHSLNKPFQCKICTRKFSLNSYLTRHMRIHKNGDQFKCNFCQEIFETDTVLIEHITTFHSDNKPYICNVCKERFTTHFALNTHSRRHKNIEQKYPTYIKIHSAKSVYSCTICNRTFRYSSSLRMHMTTSHTEKKIECNQCGKLFHYKSYLNRHISSVHSTLVQTFQCNTCKTTFKNEIDLNQHVCDPKSFECQICNRSFLRNFNLRRHMRKHPKIHQFKFNINSGLNDNIPLPVDDHQNETLFNNHEDQDIKPIEKDNLIHSEISIKSESKTVEDHSKTSTLVQNKSSYFNCDICMKRLNSLPNLIAHKKNHYDGESLKCQYCDLKCQRLTQLFDHEKLHKGKKEPYQCLVCMKTFTKQCNLQMHRLTHAPKQLECDICKRKFLRNLYLRRHQRRNNCSGSKYCLICEQYFQNAGEYIEHTKLKHSSLFVCPICEKKI